MRDYPYRNGMKLSLYTNIGSITAQNQLLKANERLSSGLRINRASDDPAGLSIANALKLEQKVYAQGIRNLNDGISVVTLAEHALKVLGSITTRLVELAQQSANGTVSNKQRKLLDAEAQALSDEYFRISKTTEFNGFNLFDGSTGQISLQCGFGEAGIIQSGLGGAVGDGTFEASISYLTGTSKYFVDSGDFNMDGALDVVTADWRDHSVTIMLGTGSGGFSSPTSYSVGNDPTDVITADVDGDGILDLVTTDSGTFGGGDSVSVLLGTGTGTFMTSHSFAVSGRPVSVTAGDFNGDSIADLATVNLDDDSVSILLGTGGGQFLPSTSFSTGRDPRIIITNDFNGDEILDLVALNETDRNVTLFLGNGDGSFLDGGDYAVGLAPYGLTAADFNGDNILDLVAANWSDDSVSVLLGQTNGTFSLAVSYSVGADPISVTTGDFNGDGTIDIAAASRANDALSVLLGTGNGQFLNCVDYSTGTDPRDVIAGDFNGDGVLDLVTSDDALGTVSILLGNVTDGIAPLLEFSLKTQADAVQVLPIFQRKLDQLSVQRGQIGAFQSRIDVALNTLTVTIENLGVAESRIRDIDAAQEAADLVRLQILQRSAIAVLAQANAQPQLVLSLLSG